MIQSGIPVAARRAAQHCAQLLSRAAAPVDPAQEVARLAQRFAATAAPVLAEWCDARGLQVEVESAALIEAEAVFAKIGVHAVNSFFALGSERTGALVTVATCEMIAQFERLLGGDGRIDRTNVRLPQSALQFAARFEQRVLEALRQSTDREEFSLAASQGKATEMAPFSRQDRVWALDFSIQPPGAAAWTITLVLCRATLSQLLDARAASPATGRALGERGISQTAIGLIEMPMRAILVDAAVPLARLARLEPGAIIPVAINRAVPLMLEHAVVAHGTAGEIDDRVALEINHTSLPGNA